MKKYIPKVYLIFSLIPIVALLLFYLLGLVYSGNFYSEFESVTTIILIGIVFLAPLLALMGAILVNFFRESFDRTLIRIGIALSIAGFMLWLGSFVFGQQFIFNQDFLNLSLADPFLFKAYSIIETDKTWQFLNERTLSLSSVVIGMIDSGIDVSGDGHPEFIDVNLGSTPNRERRDIVGEGHGTQVAGIIGANNISLPDPNKYTFPQMNGILSGVNNLSYVLEMRRPLFSFTIFNKFVAPVFTLAASVEDLSQSNAKIINMSIGADVPVLSLIPELLNLYSRMLETNQDILFITSAGNASINADFVAPANLGDDFDNLIVVGATDITPSQEDTRLSLSNYGDAVNISAPGIAVYSPAPRGKGNYPPDGPKDYDRLFSGTSASAPMVTGVAAILKALEPEYQKYAPGFQMTPAEIKEILQKSADPIVADEPLGSGCFDPNNNPQGFNGCRLNAYRAVAWLFPPTPVILEEPEVIPK